ncbi:MAG: HD domain-containing phosphohydrolase, partial [Dehalococcoidia bacterium]
MALLGAGLTVLSLLTVLHGLTPLVPDQDDLSWFAMALALPAGLGAGFPLLVPRGRLSGWIAARWKPWSAAVVAVAAAGGALLVLPVPGVHAPSPAPALRWGLALTAVAGAVALARRQVRLYRIGQQPATLVTATAALALGTGAAMATLTAEGSLAWWLVHALNGVAVLTAAAGALALTRRNRTLSDVLAPVVRDDPMAALEIGLTPEMTAFVAALDRKDRVTREHVVRVAELSVRVAEHAGVPAARLRTIGLAALMHDIGKLLVPSAILTKPGALSDEEFAAIKTHAARGAAMLERSPQLAAAAPLVRWHHERHDGRGYPDGLAGDAIPFDVAIISVCDA